jgi:hypothetical protein
MENFRRELFRRSEPLVQVYNVRRDARVYQDVDGSQPRLPPRLLARPLPKGTPVKVLKTVTAIKKLSIEKTPKKAGKPGKKVELSKKVAKQVVKQEDNWSLVKVLTSIDGVANLQGWVKRDEIGNDATAGQVEIYKNLGTVPDVEPPLHAVRFLPGGTKVRMLEKQGNWALVGLLSPLPRFKYLQGWVFLDELEPVEA